MKARKPLRTSKPQPGPSKEPFRFLFDHHPLPMWVYDLETFAFLEVNHAAVEKYGYGREEFLKMTLKDIRPSEDVTRLDDGVAKLRVEQRHSGEWRHTLKDGRVIDVEITSHALAYNGRKAASVTVQDITARKHAEKLIKESEIRHRSLFENMLEGFAYCRMLFEKDTPTDFEYLEVNNAFEKITGLRDVVGKRVTEAIPGIKESNPELFESYGRVAKTGRPERFEIHVKPLETWFSVSVYSIHQGYFAAVFNDITERKQADREFRLMAQTVASAQDCISITDLENRILFVNDAFRDTYGYTTEELLGKDVSILTSPNTTASITAQILHNTLSGGWHGEILNLRKDGSDFPVELWTSVVRDEGGIPVAMVGLARDITDRKIAEEHLRQREEQFRLIAENVADMIAVVDLNGRRIYNSPSYKSILGDPELMKSTDGFQEIHPDDVARVKQVFQETIRTGIGQRIEYRFLLKDGTIRNIDSKGTVIRDSDGKISQVIVVSRDVTEEKLLAAQFLRAQRMESIGTLAGGIAHDLNNVLAPILMSIEVLKSKIPDPGGQKLLGLIETSAKRGSEIVKQVLTFGRGVKGDRILVHPKHVINEVVKIARETFSKAIEVTTDISRDLWTVSADPTQMHQVLLNMLVNARDAMPKGGTLAISAENINLDDNYARMHLDAKPGPYVSLAITDTGSGIPVEIRAKIFEPFFTTKEIGTGTGLGLSTTLAIVKSHGGFINLYSESGKGTTFIIYIPATGTTSGTTAASEVPDLPMGNGELILIIDDEAAIREITKETLEAYGYKAMTASDGAEGVALFAENKKTIKVVITDIMMPIMDGTAAIYALRKINPDLRIIAASGLTTNGQITTPSESSVHAFLTKPYTAEKLLKAMAAALR